MAVTKVLLDILIVKSDTFRMFSGGYPRSGLSGFCAFARLLVLDGLTILWVSEN